MAIKLDNAVPGVQAEQLAQAASCKSMAELRALPFFADNRGEMLRAFRAAEAAQRVANRQTVGADRQQAAAVDHYQAVVVDARLSPIQGISLLTLATTCGKTLTLPQPAFMTATPAVGTAAAVQVEHRIGGVTTWQSEDGAIHPHDRTGDAIRSFDLMAGPLGANITRVVAMRPFLAAGASIKDLL